MENCDVLVVGGGPAGSSCAWKLGLAGVDVIVLDRSPFPRNKVCAGWITPPVLTELNFSIEEYQQWGIIQPITRFRTGLIDATEIETNYPSPVSYGIRRFEFDDFLLRRAKARLRLGESVRSIRREGGDWIVNDKFRAPVLIGAGGHFCPVARWFSPPREQTLQADDSCSINQPTVVAQEVEFKMTASQQRECSVLPERPELFFCSDLKGYGWIFRKANYLNIGLGREDETQLSTHVTQFVQSLTVRRKIPKDLSDHFHGHAYRLRTELPPSTMQSNLLLVGDAAGLAERHSGEGIRPAIESGLLAAKSYVETDGNRRTELEACYADKLRHRFNVPAPIAALERIPLFVRLAAAHWLMRSHLFAQRVLLDRWFLNTSQSPLAN